MARIVFTNSLLFITSGYICFASSMAAQASDESEFRNQLISLAFDLDVGQLSENEAMIVLLGISESCCKVGKPELAETFLNQAELIARKGGRSRHYELMRTALKLPELDAAVEIANSGGKAKNKLLDKIDLERFRRGDKEAIKRVPRDELGFFAGLEIAGAYLNVGDLEGAEKFVTEAVIVDESNDPRTVVAFTFRDMAVIYRDRDDLLNAKKYIDKAMEVGGNLFYSGYSIKVTKRSIYGELTKELDKLAQLAANHRGHMGRELVQSLIRELVKTGHYNEAKRTTKYLDNPADVNSVMKRVAAAQAAAGDLQAAEQTIEVIEDPSNRSLAHLAMAAALWKNGKRELATKIALGEYRSLKREEWGEANDQQFQSLLSLFGSMQRSEEVNALLKKATTPWRESLGLMNAIKGFADSQTKAAN